MASEKAPLQLGLLLGGSALLGALWLRRRRQRLADPYGFDTPVDRTKLHTVKHELPLEMYGEAAKEALNLWVADMELPCCEEIRETIVRRAAEKTFGYTLQPTAIWESAGRWLVEQQGWSYKPPPEHFAFSASVVTSAANIIRAMTNPGDQIALMVPLYAPLQNIVLACGRTLIRYHLQQNKSGQYDMDVKGSLSALLDTKNIKILILCNPHNPIGRVWKREELLDLARICQKRGIVVMSDEIWADWCFERFTPFQPVAQEVGCKCITLGAPTKTWSMAGLHASYVVVADDELRKQYLAYTEPSFLTFASIFATEMMLVAYDRGGPWFLAAKAYIKANLVFLEHFLLAHVPGVRLVPHQATYLAWLDCSGLGFDSGKELNSFILHEARLVLSPGSEFDAEKSWHFQRMNIACSRCLLEEAGSRLRAAVARRSRTR
ncbi:patB [Symbiodinium sp. CCMP2592]|nr:patB [Symbiodinium sp. CCMP2592]